jgi:hypothetical protein
MPAARASALASCARSRAQGRGKRPGRLASRRGGGGRDDLPDRVAARGCARRRCY